MRNVDANQVSLDATDKTQFQVQLEAVDTQKAQEALVVKSKKKSKSKKLGKKVKLVIGND